MTRIWLSIIVITFCGQLKAQNQNISNGYVFDGEPYIAVNPNNNQHLVVAWMGLASFSQKLQIKTRTSFDGGQTWSSVNAIPHTSSGYTCADPSLDFDENGNPMVCYIDFTGTTPPISGAVYIRKSTDGGLTWGNAQEVINANHEGTKWPIDRPWMKIDKAPGPLQGTIYITTFNGNRTDAPFHPYLSVSTDGGNTFHTRYADTTGWLSGPINNLPMCSPTLSSTGVFYGVYGSYVPSQNVYAQSILARSSNGGITLTHKPARIQNPPAQLSNYPNAKKSPLLVANPANPNHLAYFYVSAHTGDLDIYMIETTDQGATWTQPHRINADSVNNGKMQDMLWADFDYDGDLVVSWRDRRNGQSGTYETQSEIWATVRYADSAQFEPNFQLTDQALAYDTILASEGNDFMGIDIANDTLYAVWGDVRSGTLNIWFQKMDMHGNLLHTAQLDASKLPKLKIYPNPTYKTLHLSGTDWINATLFNLAGQKVASFAAPHNESGGLDVSALPAATYLLVIQTPYGVISREVVKR